jgi:sugar phosphate permease
VSAGRLSRRFPFYYGWVMVAVAGAGVFASGPGQTYIVSVMVEPLIEETGWSRTLVSGLYSAGSIAAVVGAILAGRALDRFGARIVLTAVVAMFGLAALMMGKITSPVHLFFGFWAIRSFGQTALVLVSTSLVAIWFVRLRGRATAVTALAAPAGQAALPPLVFVIIALSDWRTAWTVMAIAIWVLLLPAAVLLVRRSPESEGLLPDGDRRPPPTSSAASNSDAEQHWTSGEAMRTRAFWLLLFAGVALSLIGTALIFHHISLMKTKGVDEGMAAAILSVVALVALATTFATGYLLDRFPNRIVLAVGQGVMVAAMLSTLLISSTWEGFVYGVLLGVAQGLVMTTNIVIWPNYFGRRHIGSVRGAASIGMVVSSGLGPLPFGALFEATNSYDAAILGFLALPVLCGVAALAASPPKKTAPLPQPT